MAVPWAAHASKYLESIDRLTVKKWDTIMDLALPLIDATPAVDLVQQSDDDSSAGSAFDPRSEIVISDDEDAELEGA